MKWRVHVISGSLFLGTLILMKVIWDNPRVVLYLVLLVLAIITYGGIYIMVKAKVDEPSRD